MCIRDSSITLSGRLRTGSYEDKEGNKKYIAEVVAEDFKFVGGKKVGNNEQFKLNLEKVDII